MRGNAAEAAVLAAFTAVGLGVLIPFGGGLPFDLAVVLADERLLRVQAQVFVVPVEECARFKGYLRLEPTANNQRLGVRFAADHTLERWLDAL